MNVSRIGLALLAIGLLLTMFMIFHRVEGWISGVLGLIIPGIILVRNDVDL